MILLCFKKIIVGKITYKNDKLLYTSHLKGEQELKSYPVSSIYQLFGSNEKELDNLPSFLEEILSVVNNEYYVNLAQIKPSDNYFQKLEKLAKINWSKDGFFITTKENFTNKQV